MNFSNHQDIKPEINMISMVDVVLQLVIFFMLTTHFAYQYYQSSIRVNLPQAKAEKTNIPKQLTLTVTKDNQVYLGSRQVSLGELPSVLRQEVGQTKGTDNLLVVRADREVIHGRVVQVMDLARQAGIERLAIATDSATGGAGEGR